MPYNNPNYTEIAMTCRRCGGFYEVAGERSGDGWNEPRTVTPLEDPRCPVCGGHDVECDCGACEQAARRPAAAEKAARKTA